MSLAAVLTDGDPQPGKGHAPVQRLRTPGAPLADTKSRLNRIFTLEQGIYAVGRLEFAKVYENEDPSVRCALIDVKTFTTYQRQFNNLSLQEERLRRHAVQDSAELEKLIRDREIRR